MKKYLKEGMNCAVVRIGGLGHMALKFLKAMCYKSAAFTTSQNKIDMIKGLGALEVILSIDNCTNESC
jgi:D-arabinose 1-dehydrogenase-like Zn-dependent alcohol dehydrogenase